MFLQQLRLEESVRQETSLKSIDRLDAILIHFQPSKSKPDSVVPRIDDDSSRQGTRVARLRLRPV